MARLNFFALGDDQRDIIAFLFAETDVVVYELNSEYDQELRQFRSLSEMETAFQLGSFHAAHLQLWSPTVSAPPTINRFALKVPGHSFRYEAQGMGLMQLYLDGMKAGVIHETHYGHWSEAGARQASGHHADECDWCALRKLSGRIQRHIRGRLAVAKLYTTPILPQALAAVRQGAGLVCGPDIHRADSMNIVPMES